MRALTVRQPWAWAIIHGGKDVENRSRNIAGSYRGPVAIHAGVSTAAVEEGMWHPVLRAEYLRLTDAGERPDIRYGELIGVADLVDAHHAPAEGCMGLDPFDRARLCSMWAQPDVWHLVLVNARPLPAPVPYRGRLGLWTLPDGVIDLEAVAS
ncbi:hypothetical protein V2J56_09045 [Georgenia sp. MJ206]|uniref:hypothetical protein n=1 Tax=Georgenia wangjunii TaxID=3117730 RepID=UPI002F25F14B